MTDLTVIDLFTALALVLVIEGVSLALFPGAIRIVLQRLDELPAEALRWGGLLIALLGAFLLYLIGA